MAIAVSGTRLAVGAQFSAGGFDIPITSTPTDGASIFVTMASNDNTTVASAVTDTKGNVYALMFDAGNVGVGVRMCLFVCKEQHNLVSGDLVKITAGFGGVEYVVDAVTGLGTAHVPDVTKVGFNTSVVGSFTTGASSATAYAVELVWVAVGTPVDAGTTQTLVPGSGFTQHASRATASNVSLYVEYLITTGTGAQTGDGTFGTTNSKYVAALATFPEPQSPENTYRAVTGIEAEVAAQVGANRGASQVIAEVAAIVGATRAASQIIAEVAFNSTVPPPTTVPQRPLPIIAG